MRDRIFQKFRAYQQTVDHFLHVCAEYTDEQLNFRPPGGKWSAIQNMHHLLLSEELSLQYVRKKLSFHPPLEKRGPGAAWRGFLLWFYLNVPLKFKAPEIVGEPQLPESASLADTRARWKSAQAEWERFFQEMPPELADKVVYRHPLAGRLGWPETIDFFHHHFQRHHRQIQNALQAARAQHA
jgi:hypothetical protein